MFACAITAHSFELAREVLPADTAEAVICSVAVLMQRLLACTKVQTCSFYWVSLALFVGAKFFRQDMERSRPPWEFLSQNLTRLLIRARGPYLRRMADQEMHLLGHPAAPMTPTADATSMLMMYADNARYFKEPNVAPFVRHMGCYAKSRGMRFVLDAKGTRVKHKRLALIDVSIVDEFFVTARETDDRVVGELGSLLGEFRLGDLARARELTRFEESLGINYADPLNFDKIWALGEQLSSVEPGRRAGDLLRRRCDDPT